MADFDAIVIGSGMSGGWAAKELSERGLKVLVLERGREILPETDYTDNLAPWEKYNRGRIAEEEVARDYPIQSLPGYAMTEVSKQFWVKDSEHPYETPEGRPYNWLRGYHLGGRSITWARLSLRWSEADFESNKRDGHGVDWPIRYADLAPWYDHVERFAGIAGIKQNVPQIPDGQFQPGFALNAGEQWLKQRIEQAFPTRRLISMPCAHLTSPTPEQEALGRAQCQVRTHCHQGCSLNAYFSSIAATLPAARATGRCTIITDAIVAGIDYDPAAKRVSGVRVIDTKTRAGRTYTGRMVFVCASAIPSAMILLSSRSDSFPDGLANRSGQVGRNLMDHIMGVRIAGTVPGLQDRYYKGRRPTSAYVPRYANVTEPRPFLRGFSLQGSAYRPGWTGDRPGIGVALKAANRVPGPWQVALYAIGEQLPNPDNRVTLSRTLDRWNMPLPYIDATFGDNDRAVMRAAREDGLAMLQQAGLTDVTASPPDRLQPPGTVIHEMGTARMGRDPTTSVLNGWAQAHDIANLFVTDGSAMASAAVQNPSLTYMAITARAAAHAAELLKTGQI